MDRSREENYVHDANGAATKEIFGARTADSYAAFLLPYLRKGQRLLDTGCGQGTITIGIAEVVAPGEVVGIDMEEKVISTARELAKEKGVSHVRLKLGTSMILTSRATASMRHTRTA